MGLQVRRGFVLPISATPSTGVQWEGYDVVVLERPGVAARGPAVLTHCIEMGYFDASPWPRPGCDNCVMPEHAGQPGEMEFWLDSTLESVDSAESEVLRIAAEAGMEEEQQHRLGMAVRESMVNAIVHGNRYNANKKVQLRVRSGAGRLTVEIADQGEGFEMGRLPDPLAEENLLRQSGRGILLIQAFVDEFVVERRAEGGTQVRLVKYLNRKS